MGNVRTDQIKRTAKELVRRFPDKFSNNFDENKRFVAALVKGTTIKTRNQIAGYITRSLVVEQQQTDTSEEPSTDGETE